MTRTTKPIEVEVGTILPSGINFISQHPIENEKAKFSIDVPGNVTRCGEAVVQTILPRARIVSPGIIPIRAARISAAVIDSLTLRRTSKELLAQIDSQTPLGFALRFSSKRSIGEVFEAAANAQGEGCGCGCGGGEAAIPGAVSIGLAPSSGGNLKWSDPINAMIYAKSDGALDFGGTEKATCIAVRDNCTETWEFWANTTTCTGLQCTSPEVCKCDTDKRGKAITKCDGWIRCNCNV